jgi:glycosyltransferase involved in cell wall biosynthesis
MITIGAIPKAFTGVHEIIQRNAILSWNMLPCNKEIILCGTEDGVLDIAKEVNARVVDNIRCDEFGTPTVDSIFSALQETATYNLVCYINSDIIITPHFVPAIMATLNHFSMFLLTARRWNVKVDKYLEFKPGWDVEFVNHVKKWGVLDIPQAIDIFVFTRGLFHNIPPFSIGRSYWDNWLLSEAKRNRAAVIDGTADLTIVHQNHPYTGFKSLKEIQESTQGRRNFLLAGNSKFYLGKITDATHTLSDGRLTEVSRKTVSIIISHNGSFRSLEECLRSISSLDYHKGYLEIIVVSDISKEYLSDLSVRFPFIKICSNTMHNHAAAYNKGASYSTGEILAFVESNCLPSKNWIQQGLKALEDSAYQGIVTGSFLFDSTTGQNLNCVQNYDRARFYFQLKLGHLITNIFTHRRVFYEVGSFNEEHAQGCRDEDWYRRALSQEKQIIKCNDCFLFYSPIYKWCELYDRVMSQIKRDYGLAKNQSPDSELCRVKGQSMSSNIQRDLKALLQNTWASKTDLIKALFAQIVVICLIWREVARSKLKV